MTGQSKIDEEAVAEALAWRSRLGEGNADWDAYSAWLEADPRHRRAYNAIDLVAAAVDDQREQLRTLLRAPGSKGQPRGRLSRAIMYGAGGIAAAAAFLVAVPALRTPEAVRSYEAVGAARRVIALANGIEVSLSPSSRIVVHGDDAHHIQLTAGEAYFDVRHDPSRTLIVSVGDYKITDIGTRFSVNLAGKAIRLGVAEGTLSVSLGPGGNDVRVTAGHQLFSERNQLTLSPVSTAEVGSWRLGRLSYNDAPLSLVAADIFRYSGRPVTVDPSLEKEHFSGSLAIGDGSRLLSDLATVLGAHIRPEKNGDRIVAAAR